MKTSDRTARSLGFWLGLLAAFGAVGLLAGCSSMILGKPKAPENVPGLTVTAEQLRIRTRVMVKPLTGMFIEAFESIADQTEDPSIRYAAVRYQTEVVPAIREACFTPAPVVAFLDTYALSLQLVTFFHSGPGAPALGEYASIAEAAAIKMRDYIEDLGDELGTDEVDENAKGVLAEWAKENPIDPTIASRESIANQATNITMAIGLSLGDVVDTMVTSVDDLNRKLDVFSDQIPKQARWEAELFTMGTLGEMGVDESLARIPELLDSSLATLETVQSMPDVVAAERAVVLETLREEVDRSLRTLQEERAVVLMQIAAERAEVMAVVDAQRIAMTADLRAERLAIEAMVAREREALLEGMEELRGNLIDDVFVKVLWVLAMAGVYLIAVVFGILWAVGRMRRTAS